MNCKSVFLTILIFTIAHSFTLNTLSPPQEQSKTANTAVFVTFVAIYPDDKLSQSDKIYIRGDNCNMTWTSGLPLSKKSNNTWTTMLLCPTGVRIQVKLLLNDKSWMLGANQWFVAYDRFDMKIYPSFNPTINKIYDTQSVRSYILNNTRKCSIYLPPSYNDNRFKTYPLIFMHDGQNLFEDSKAAFGVAWKIQDTLNDLIGKGEISQVIVVGIWNTNDRNNEYTYSYDSSYKFGGKGDLYLDFIQKQLEPIVSKKWFTDRVQNQYGYNIGGSSLGGLISCYAMYTRPEFFRNAICMSSSFWWNNQDFNNKIITSKYNTNTIAYLDSGDAGQSQDGKNQTLTVKAHFEKIGYKSQSPNQNLYYYLDKGGQHSQYYWGKRFYIPMKSIFNSVLPSESSQVLQN